MVMKAGQIIFAGSIAQKPWHGGHTWVFLQYLLGFKKLGWEVLFLDELDPNLGVARDGQPCSVHVSFNASYLHCVMSRFGLQYSLLVGPDQSIGLSFDEVVARVRSADLFVNVMGFLQNEEILTSADRRVFLDID